ncbi:MAG TPA: oxidoreductase C-terminal domain-containing protein, partial [Burkholderiales bacterium]|nr:oxidoreductase C-terminal domain-containing protein [Burkholderiales bacterium]
PVRLESVQNAQDQARIAAATLTGKGLPYDAVPWFWSDQYDAKLQMAGLCAAQDEEVVRGSQEEGKFSVYYLRAGRLVAVHSINRPADHMLARKLIAARVEPDVERLADPGFDLKTLLPA